MKIFKKFLAVVHEEFISKIQNTINQTKYIYSLGKCKGELMGLSQLFCLDPLAKM